MNKKTLIIIMTVFLSLVFIAFFSRTVFLSVDILKTLPLFSESGWSRPHNSLLADPVFQFEPWRVFAKREFSKGLIPTWNKLNGGGEPLIAVPHSSIFFPLNLLYYLLPVSLSLFMIALIKVFLYPYFFYLYLRSNKISKFSSFLGAFLSLSGFYLVWLQWPQTNVFMFFPLVLLFVDKIYKTKGYINIIILSIILFFSYLGGHPETFFMIGIVTVIYSLVRYSFNFKNLFKIFVSFGVSMLLSSFLILPFFEYLVRSYMLLKRAEVHVQLLPLQSLIGNIVPFFYGAPHLYFYKPFLNTNFQEMIGGYTGLIVIIVSIVTVCKVKLDRFLKSWIVIFIISFLLSYQIPIISSLISKTPFGLSANQRMVAFMAFSMVILFAKGLDYLINRKKDLLGRKNKIVFLTLLAISFICFFTVIFIPFNFNPTYNLFIPFLLKHIILIFSSTILFFFILSIKNRLSKKILILSLCFVVFTQTVLFFITYNTFSKRTDYYPQTAITRYIESHPGRTLQVGNPSIVPNINIVYGIENAQNDDALEVASYRIAFDKAFPNKNSWGNVDEVSLSSLRYFGISHLVADYDLRYKKITIQKQEKNIYPLNQKNITEEFMGNGQLLQAVRIKTANYNRKNSCLIRVLLRNKTKNLDISNSYFLCSEIYNNMFFTFKIVPVILANKNVYSLTFFPLANGKNNYIGLMGGSNIPYLDLLVGAKNMNDYQLILKDNGLYLLNVNHSGIIEGGAIVKSIVMDSNTEFSFIADAINKTSITVKKTNYPGWEAKVNNRSVKIQSSGPFMKIVLPKGQDFIQIYYQPLSLYLGFLISLISVVVIFILMSRNIYQNKKNIFHRYLAKLYTKLNNNFKGIEENKLFFMGGVSIIFASLSYAFLYKIIPIKFNYINNGVISWFSYHHYPKQQDYFYYFLAMLTIICIGITIWFFLISKNKRKK